MSCRMSLWWVCDYVPGDTLAEVVEREGALAPERARALAHDLCEALADLHAHGAVHRDVAPANIVLAKDGAHLIDFGCAGVPALEDDSQKNPQGTWGFCGARAAWVHDGGCAGGPVCRGPVWLRTRQPGRCPRANSARELRAHIAGLPEGLRAVIERACAFEPSARYQTAADLGAAFCRGSVRRGRGEPGCHGAADGRSAGRFRCTGVRRRTVAYRAPRLCEPSPPAVIAPPVACGGGAGACGGNRLRRVVCVGRACSPLRTLRATVAGDAQQGAVQQQDRAPSGGQTTVGAATSTGELVEEAAKALTITESSWYVSSGGFVRYAVGIANTDDDVTALFPTVLITGRDADGNVLFSDTQVLNSLFPGETHYWGGQAGNGAAPASVEFSIARPGDWEVEQGSGASSSYTVSGVMTSQDLLGGTVVTGELTFVARGDEAYGGNQVAIVAIGRDAQGQMVWGEVGFVSEPAVGATVPFEVTSLGSEAPAYTTVEVHAYPW